MPVLTYRRPGLTIRRGGSGSSNEQVRHLQRDLRQLGYLRKGIDGKFGKGTELSVAALQHDLLSNFGKSTQNDGDAPVQILDYNQGRVVDVTGIVDQKLAGCISDMLDDPKFPVLPKTDDPKEENSKVVSMMKEMPSSDAPIPFLMAMLKQESGLKHYNEPKKNDDDTYIVIGLDTNAGQKHIITSRGYGAGQYTLFHHPPQMKEIEDFMLDVGKNLQKAIWELKEKFHHFVNGKTSGTRADDRTADFGSGPLRPCKYKADDPRHMHDCKQCMIDAGQANIKEGVTPFYKGSKHKFVATQYYKPGSYDSVPIRKKIECDWPYAARRYNGSGVNSYHYQARVLRNVLNL
jgi:hypothetical protein